MRYEQVTDGQWFVIGYGLSDRQQRQVCCHCLLVHDWRFRLNPDNTISAMVVVNKRATAAARKRYGITNIVQVLLDWWAKRKESEAAK